MQQSNDNQLWSLANWIIIKLCIISNVLNEAIEDTSGRKRSKVKSISKLEGKCSKNNSLKIRWLLVRIQILMGQNMLSTWRQQTARETQWTEVEIQLNPVKYYKLTDSEVLSSSKVSVSAFGRSDLICWRYCTAFKHRQHGNKCMRATAIY